MVEQIDFLSKEEIRDNALRRRTAPEEPKADKGKPEHATADGKACPLAVEPLSTCTYRLPLTPALPTQAIGDADRHDRTRSRS